jgi:hypothetical protein
MANEIGYYIVELKGNAPGRTLTINLGVNATNGEAQGQVSWTGTANGKPEFTNAAVKGQIHHGGFGPDRIFLALTGEATVGFPPAMVIINEALVVNITANDTWKGRATLSLNGHAFAEVEVAAVPR